jgi:molybdate transport system ATP-binding protein
VNLVRGVLRDGRVDTGGHSLHVATDAPEGPVLVTIHPTAISVHALRPGGSPRNVWETVVERVEPLGSRARLRTGGPLPLTVEVTEASRREFDLEPGTGVWIAVKATEIGVRPDVR